MSEAFPTNRGLWPMYRLMVGAHRYAIDYIEQAPVIVLAATRDGEHAFIQEQFRKMCESKARLRDVMRSYGLPLPLRLLDARVLTARRATVIRRLALMNPSTLAQIIPSTQQKQNAWLRALQNWCERMASRSKVNNYRCLSFEWAATTFPGVTYTEADVVAGRMVDFVRRWGAISVVLQSRDLRTEVASSQVFATDRVVTSTGFDPLQAAVTIGCLVGDVLVHASVHSGLTGVLGSIFRRNRSRKHESSGLLGC